MLRALPPVLHLPAGTPGFEWVRVSQELIARELSAGRVGASAIAARLADAIFIEATRCHFAEQYGESPEWASTMHDPVVGLALTLMHRDPQRRWTVEAIAGEVGLSRTAFAARFVALVGEPPMRHLARHRIARAMRQLRSSDAGIAEIAQHVGYDSEAAFCRAFSKHAGLTPAAFRRRTRDGTETTGLDDATDPRSNGRPRARGRRDARVALPDRASR